MRNLVDAFISENNLRSEGRRGIVLMARLARAIGYRDSMSYGQLDSQCSIGDLITFFEDNSGAVEAVVEWVSKQRSSEWMSELQGHVNPQDDEDDDEDLL